MKKFSELVIRYRKTIIFTTIFITLVLGFFLKDLTINSDILSYLPQDDPKVVLFNEVNTKFGGSSLALVALESDDAFRFTSLTRINEITRQFKEIGEISNVMSLTDIIDIKKTEWGLEIGKLIDSENIPRDTEDLGRLKEYALSKDMYRGKLISDDGKITVVIARLKEDTDKLSIGRRMREIVEATQGDEKIYYGGIPFQMIFLTDIIRSDLKNLIPFVVLLVMGMLFISFRSLRGVLLPLSCVLMSTIWVLGIISLLKIPLTIASDAMPVLLVAAGSAYGIHMLSRYNEVMRPGDSRREGIKNALKGVGFPIFLSGLTTMIGFLTFLSSNLNLIREFGIFTALGIAFAMVISVTFLPAVLSYLKVKRPRPHTEKAGRDWLARTMDSLGGFVLWNAKLISACCAVLVLFSLFMMTRLSREVNMIEYFQKDSKIRQAEEMMEARFGGSIPVQIVFKGDLKDPFVLKEMIRFEKFLKAQPDIRNPQSIADLICEMNWVVNGHRTIPDTREGVANLWFFIEGNDVLNQLITDDALEALIQANLGSVNTKRIIALVDQIDGYINQELRTDLVEVRISLASPDIAAELAKDRMERILSKLDWDIRKRELAWDAHSKELRESVLNASYPGRGGFEDDLIETIENKVGDYLSSDSADIPVESKKVIPLIIADIGDALRPGKSGEGFAGARTPEWDETDIVAVLKKHISQTLSGDYAQVIDNAAVMIVSIIRDESNWARVNRLIQGTKPYLPKLLENDEEFLSDMRDDLWEINEEWTAVSGSKYPNLSDKTKAGNLTKLSAQQTGIPIIYDDLDRQITKSQVYSLSIAVLLVFLLLAFRLKSLIGGLISTTPIILTVLANFTIMAIFGVPLDIITILIGSVAVGMGIDYAIHFIIRFKTEHAQGKTEVEALAKTLETTGKAIVINALSVTMGFMVLLLGNIVPMQRFGYLVAITMIISATASLTVLPALLLVTRAGFIGRLGLLTTGLASNIANKMNAKNNRGQKYLQNKEEKMSKLTWIVILSLLVACPFMYHSEKLNAEELPLTASQIIEKVDDVINAPPDQDLRVNLILIDKNGNEKSREMSMLQKGSDKRMVKFLSPADQRGIAFLSLPGDVMYLYLPAFNKVRRIASHVKNTQFAGTDFTYEDMEAIRFSEKYVPELLKEEEDHYVLQLKIREGMKSDYSKLTMWVRMDNFYPTKIEHYDKGGTLYKIMIREKIEKVDGYWISRESEMADLKAEHKTKMIIVEVKFNSGLSDDRFTERYISR